MRGFVVLLSIAFIVLTAYTADVERLFSVPPHWPKPQYDFTKNPLTPEKVELGRVLFYDPILSRNNKISCASCHSPFTAFAHVDHALSHGIEDRIGTRNAPALMNLAWEKTFMWDGAINHLDMQPLSPITAKAEMDNDIAGVVKKLQQSPVYPSLFLKAFGDSIVTGEHTLKALSQFTLTVVSANSKYDSVMQKQAVFTAQEENGYKLFQKNCASCHREPLFTNLQFENNGLPVDTTLNDVGRFKITQRPEDSLRFKVPSLRNVEFTYPYMHDGRFKKLSQVMEHYTHGIKQSKTLSKALLKPTVLSPNEKVDVVAFLLTLTDRSFLFNPKYSYKAPEVSPKN